MFGRLIKSVFSHGYNKKAKRQKGKGVKVKGKITNMLKEKISRSVFCGLAFSQKNNFNLKI
ncbi:hypothetical protein BOQ64_13505 [Chryseobacterium sp. CH25]|nr:hypothetical protein BOQ64_13505 [Chryseobacterium sp. CH25]RXM64713.1 hypothetical protein BOQ60_10890 [Chryseobacterium sp. CH1]